MAMLMTCVNYAKLVPYAALGLLSWDNLLVSAAMAAPALLGVRLGLWLIDRIDKRRFFDICHFMLLVTAVKLAYDALG